MKKLEEYTTEEIVRLDEIQRVLTEYNASVRRSKSAVLKTPPVPTNEVMENSRYRELLMAKEVGRIVG